MIFHRTIQPHLLPFASPPAVSSHAFKLLQLPFPLPVHPANFSPAELALMLGLRFLYVLSSQEFLPCTAFWEGGYLPPRGSVSLLLPLS